MKVIQVFEHERLRVGEKRNGVAFTEAHFFALSKLNEKHGHRFFTMLHRGIQFSSYVGVVQIPGLTIEILPKADNVPGKHYHLWRNVLIDMLIQCKVVNYSTIGTASLYLRRGSILDVYVAAFLEEVDTLCRRGLVKQYRPVEGNINCWKGRTHFAKHLRNHLIHQERVYAVHQVYDHHHRLNQILWQALRIIPGLTAQPALLTHVQLLINQFPELDNLPITSSTFNHVQYDRNTSRYRNAIDHAQLLLCNYIPDLQYGTYHSFMLLFNMDSLFEAFVYQQLKKVANQQDIQVNRQVSKTFWAKNKIRPDIVVHHKKSGKKYVIDTKWKKLRSHQPAAEDLRQMYVYNQYFNATKGLLLYPAVYPLSLKSEAFEKPEKLVEGVNYSENHCALGFIDMLDEKGKLSRKIGAEVMAMLASTG